MQGMSASESRDSTAMTLGVISGSGTLPFAVADRVIEAGGRVVFFAIRGFADAAAVARYPHHWVALGQYGRICSLMRREGCTDVVVIGGVVRPRLAGLRLDWGTIRIMPRLIRAFRGGDDHLLSSIGAVFEADGFRMRGLHDIAPELLVPAGTLTTAVPDARALTDIAKGRAYLQAAGSFDIGQACVVIDGHIVAVEGIEGTDAMLARVKALRDEGKLSAPAGRGVLVKAPKTTQDLRYDLPTLGPRTVTAAAAAGLAGIAVAAGVTLVAEAALAVDLANRARLFIEGFSLDAAKVRTDSSG